MTTRGSQRCSRAVGRCGTFVHVAKSASSHQRRPFHRHAIGDVGPQYQNPNLTTMEPFFLLLYFCERLGWTRLTARNNASKAATTATTTVSSGAILSSKKNNNLQLTASCDAVLVEVMCRTKRFPFPRWAVDLIVGAGNQFWRCTIESTAATK